MYEQEEGSGKNIFDNPLALDIIEGRIGILCSEADEKPLSIWIC